MAKYTVYFEIYGKRMKTTVEANNDTDAKAMIKSKIIFHKVEKQEEVKPDAFDIFKNKGFEDIFDFLGKK